MNNDSNKSILSQLLAGYFLKKHLKLHMKSSDAVLKNQIVIANGIELSTLRKGVEECHYLSQLHFYLCFSHQFIPKYTTFTAIYLLTPLGHFAIDFRAAYFVWNCTSKNPEYLYQHLC